VVGAVLELRAPLATEAAAKVDGAGGEDRVQGIRIVGELAAVESALQHRDHLGVRDHLSSSRNRYVVGPELGVLDDVGDGLAAAIGVSRVDVEVRRPAEVAQEEAN